MAGEEWQEGSGFLFEGHVILRRFHLTWFPSNYEHVAVFDGDLCSCLQYCKSKFICSAVEGQKCSKLFLCFNEVCKLTRTVTSSAQIWLKLSFRLVQLIRQCCDLSLPRFSLSLIGSAVLHADFVGRKPFSDGCLKVMNKRSSSNINRTFVQSYLAFNSVLKK